MEDIASSIDETEERYRELSRTILAVNDDRDSFSKDVRDINKACAPLTASGLAAAINTLKQLDIDSETEDVMSLGYCADDLHRRTDRELDTPGITTIRMQRLIDEMERLTKMTQRVRKMEGDLERAASKRDRLLEELTQFNHEIQSC